MTQPFPEPRPDATQGAGEKTPAFLFRDIWEGRKLILSCIGGFAALGLLMILTATPVYQADALLQLQGKKTGPADPTLAKVEGMLMEPTELEAEIEILKSNQVLGRVVESMKLDIEAAPAKGSLFGGRGSEEPKIEIEALDVPDVLRGQGFRLTLLEGGTYRWESLKEGRFTSKATFLGNGAVGEVMHGICEGEPVTLRVRTLQGKVGQTFNLTRKPLGGAIAAVRRSFDAFEKGKLTNVLALTYKDESSVQAARVLNEIINQYVRSSIERKSAEASKTLASLESKLPELKANVEAAESRLNDYRTRSGSVDIGREADISLQRSSTLSIQLSGLRQRREELLRTYKEASDVVMNLDQQMSRLQQEINEADRKTRSLPALQQEVVRLTRDVQVNTELYTAMLNSIQQLRVSRDSEIGSVTVVDPATPNPDPKGSKRSIQMVLFLFLGTVTGLGLHTAKKAFRAGIEDHNLIESKVGIPVVVTIPHSSAQDDFTQDPPESRGEGTSLLAVLHPNDLAVESLRSLRTLVHFATKDAANRVVMLTGPSPDLGKSFVTANLAVVLAQAGAKVLVIDADLRRGTLHRDFGIRERGDGFAQVLAGKRAWKDVVRTTSVPNLSLLPCGEIPVNPSELLLEGTLATFFKEASEAYEFVLIDSPPVLPVTDAILLGAHAATVFMVARYGQHPLGELQACKRRLDDHGIRIRGCIFNDLKAMGLNGANGDYKYAYHYTYKTKD
jgi:tyrosine-protein kinase Etk/Wzc